MPNGIESEASVVWDSPSIRVFVASPELVLAMKARSCRATDADDIATLMAFLHIRSMRRVIAVHDRYFPNDPLGDDKRTALRAIIGPAGQPLPGRCRQPSTIGDQPASAARRWPRPPV